MFEHKSTDWDHNKSIIHLLYLCEGVLRYGEYRRSKGGCTGSDVIPIWIIRCKFLQFTSFDYINPVRKFNLQTANEVHIKLKIQHGTKMPRCSHIVNLQNSCYKDFQKTKFHKTNNSNINKKTSPTPGNRT